MRNDALLPDGADVSQPVMPSTCTDRMSTPPSGKTAYAAPLPRCVQRR
ncbi:hypothetical protein KCP78_13330 [Salmonella enterica subsp. enterica]|nr:hypothetical protein KCP78_13330 [Salmonella enterica subsp. enterica]